jgi:hypothetical protein
MKKYFVLMIVLTIVAMDSNAQFKSKSSEQPNVADSFIHPQSSSDWLSFFNPNNFEMHHTYSANYITSGGQGLALQRYTNTMMYQFAPNLNARFDVSLQNSPYSTLDYRLQNQFSKAFISRAEINYKPWDNTILRISYQQAPFGYGAFSSYRNGFSGLNFYEGE